VFLIKALFGLYILVVMLRFLLQTVRADFYNPVCQFLVKVTNPPLKPLRRLIPGLFGLDMAALGLMLVLKLLELWLVYLVLGGAVSAPGIMVLAIAQLLSLAIDVFFFSILIQVIISWVNPGAHNPALSLLHSLNEPLLRPARRMLPPMSGFDLSPIIVMLGLQLLILLLIRPLTDTGVGLMVG